MSPSSLHPPILHLHNSASRQLEVFTPLDEAHVRLYFCGPTLYDRVHLGNLRSMLFADMLVRLLRLLYPRVTFIRNITDIDDKIIQRAGENNEEIAQLTERTMRDFHDDLNELAILPPDGEPRATAHIPQMLDMISGLIAQGHAYEAEGDSPENGKGNVLFDVQSFAGYGALSGRQPDELQAGARVDIASYKRHPGDFILWKPSASDEPGWESPYGRGRPGWHIECSAMAGKYLGQDFDIHGGGNDLLFPHHENERAQSLCAHPHSGFARYWLHVGMLLSHGEKMSKSLGNFYTIRQALDHAPAEALRLLYLGTHYRSTLDFSWEKLGEARQVLDRFYRALARTPPGAEASEPPSRVTLPAAFMAALCDDLNTSLALSFLHQWADKALAGDQKAADTLYQTGRFLGLFNSTAEEWFQAGASLSTDIIERKIAERLAAKKARDFARADALRAELAEQNILLEDGPSGTIWRKI